MRTQFTPKPEYEEAFRKCADKYMQNSDIRAANFDCIMRKNRGNVEVLSPFAPAKDGMERKNPLIVALGDSVTAGHFENVMDIEDFIGKVACGKLTEEDALEITDVRECYLEKFRYLLIDRYEQTSVSAINSGIAGDTILGMQKRLYRDVIRYQPDLVIINASLNWGSDCGGSDIYEKILREVVSAIKTETRADIILMTPNMEVSEEIANPKSTLEERVDIIRRIAKEEQVCLADAYRIWKMYEDAGYPVAGLLANGRNHPSVVGHEVFAKLLMRCM